MEKYCCQSHHQRFFLHLPSVLLKRTSSSCSYNCVKGIVTPVKPLTFWTVFSLFLLSKALIHEEVLTGSYDWPSTLTKTCTYISTLWGTCQFTQPLIQLSTLYTLLYDWAPVLSVLLVKPYVGFGGYAITNKKQIRPLMWSQLTKEWPNNFFMCWKHWQFTVLCRHMVQIKGFKHVAQQPHQKNR